MNLGDMDAERIHFSSENAEPAKLEYTTIYPDICVCMVHYHDTKVTIDVVDVSIRLVFHSLSFWSIFDQLWQVIPFYYTAYIPQKNGFWWTNKSQLRCINPSQGLGTCLRPGGILVEMLERMAGK